MRPFEVVQLALLLAGLSYTFRTADITAGAREWFFRHHPRAGWMLDVDERPARTFLTGRPSRSWRRAVADGTGDLVWKDPETRQEPLWLDESLPPGTRFVWVSMQGTKLGRLLMCPFCIGFHLAWAIILGRELSLLTAGLVHSSGWTQVYTFGVNAFSVWVLGVWATKMFEGGLPFDRRHNH